MIPVSNMIQAGWSLVPIPPRKKGPNTVGWNERDQCVSAVADMRRLEGGNVGLAHAYCTPIPTCAIDVDHYPQAKAWLATLGVELDELLFKQDAVVICSGKRYSLKLLYRLPSGLSPLESKKVIGRDERSILEFRCATKDGRTVQDVLPPSVHPDGHQYQWVGAGNPLELPEVPASLLRVWQQLIGNGCRVAGRTFPRCGPSAQQRQETPRQVAIIQTALSHIDANCSYELWRNVVWAVLSTQWDCAEDLAQAWSKSAPDRYNEDAFWLVARSYLPDRENPITVGTIYHHARQGGWHD